MIWGCITLQSVSKLYHIIGIIDADVYLQILQESLLETLKKYGVKSRHVIFQQDNDPKHTSKKARDWFTKKGMKLLPWPAQSPDLNPIENLWDYLARQVAKQATQHTTEDQVWEELQKEWYKIEPGLVQRLYEGMPKWLESVVRRKGWNIPYQLQVCRQLGCGRIWQNIRRKCQFEHVQNSDHTVAGPKFSEIW